jgi:hypothetical protein
MALAGCGGESTESKTYLLYVVEKKRTKDDGRLWRRGHRDEEYLFFLRGEENKGDAMALADCGEESSEMKTYLSFFVEKKEQRRRHGSCRLWRREYRDECIPLFYRGEQRRRHGSCRLWRREYRDECIPLFYRGEEENKGDAMAPASCGEESKETYLLYVVEKKRTKATTWLLQIVEDRESMKTYLLYVVEKKITKTTTSMVM